MRLGYFGFVYILNLLICGIKAASVSNPDDSTLVLETSNLSLISIEHDKCKKDNHIIHNTFELQNLKDCETIEGDILITGFKEPIIEFGTKLQSILGSISIKNAPSLVRIEAPSLRTIRDSFSLRELTSLVLVSFPSLESIASLEWKVLPILSAAHFGDSISIAESIIVSDTSLTSFAGLVSSNLKIFDINNNRYLETIITNVENVTESLHIASNSENLFLNLSNLKFANNLTIHETAKLELTNLVNVAHSASFLNNQFKNLKLPSLRAIGGTLRVSKNHFLSHVEFPQVDEIGGGLVVINNTLIDNINFLPKLSVIGGAMELIGNIKEIQLKQIKLIKGSAKIKSLISSFDCSKWTKSEVGSIIRGSRIECSSDGNDYVSENPNSDPNGTSQFELESEEGSNERPGIDFSSNSGANKLQFGLLFTLIVLALHLL